MATVQDLTGSAEAAIISRMIHPENADLTNDAAQAVLRLISLDKSDLDRMHVLAVRNQDDALTPNEKAELESYLRISMMVDLIHAKARLSLRKHR